MIAEKSSDVKVKRVGHDEGIFPSRFLLEEAVKRRSSAAYYGCEDAKPADLTPERRVGGGFVELLDRTDRQERYPDLLEEWREVWACDEGDDVSAVAKGKSDR